MLYILAGSDFRKIRSRAAALAKGCEVVRFGEGGEPFERAPSYLGALGLFAKKIALLLDRPFEVTEGEALILAHAKAFANAEEPVILVESALSADAKKKLPSSATVEFHDAASTDGEPPLSVFALTDAFAGGRRKDAWVLYRKLIESGSAPEEIHGALAWQARAMVLASKTKSAAEAGLKPFVYTKARQASAQLGESETEYLSRELVRILHSSRMGGGDLEDLLEVFLLKKA